MWVRGDRLTPSEKERNGVLEQLDRMDYRLMTNTFDKSDVKTLIDITRELVTRAYQKDIRDEVNDEIIQEIEDGMDMMDFQD